MVMRLGDITLKPGQETAVNSLRNGKILIGGVGSGKTYASIFWSAYYNTGKKVYVIATAMKRDYIEKGKDKPDWQQSLEDCGIFDYVVDSWNNIKKYTDVKDAVFIFDEQRVVGWGTWAKSFIKITQQNTWILLSATPGDTWLDYLAVFVANGFYKNKSSFTEQHIEYDRFVKYPKIKKFHNTEKLEELRRRLVVPMTVLNENVRTVNYLDCQYDKVLFDKIKNTRFDFDKGEPIATASGYVMALRKVVNTSYGRKEKAREIMFGCRKLIVFYNFNYERDILIDICESLGKPYAEWTGHAHEPIPNEQDWIYLCQYASANDSWNCIETNSMMFFSMNHSWKKMEQSMGRVDRTNQPNHDLQYYVLTSKSKIDKDIRKTVENKRVFNESIWAKEVSSYFRSEVPKRYSKAAPGRSIPGDNRIQKRGGR